ncbi:MAG: glycosyltransferase family 39 protein, partial [bacterium]|nr:glycosyltransferase family 39 protein [bacterium]
MGKKEKALFFIIVFFAIILRIYNLDKVPPELFGDEVDVGYQAYSVLKTGRDVYNQFLPSYFHSFSEWRAPLYLYATVPFIAVFGLNEWGVRLTAVFFGIISVVLVYLVAKQLFKSPAVSLTAAAFLAFSPWHLQYSRAGFELTLLLSLVLAGVYGFLRTKENKRWWFLTTVCFSLTFYTYSTAVLFVPLFCFFLWFIFRESARPGLKHLLPAMIILLPFLVNLISGQARSRFETLSVTNLDQVTVNDLNFARNNAVNFWWKPKDGISLK